MKNNFFKNKIIKNMLIKNSLKKESQNFFNFFNELKNISKTKL